MYTTDLSMRFDPVYGPISKRFHENPGEFAEAFAKAWYKLTHRDMGPVKRCLGAYVAPEQIWQDPVPEGKSISDSDATELKELIMTNFHAGMCFRKELSPPEMILTELFSEQLLN